MSEKLHDSAVWRAYESHTTAMVFGVVTTEFFSHITFDLRLIRASVQQRRIKPMPVAYMIARYTMIIGVCITAFSEFRHARGHGVDLSVLHWIRVIFLSFSLAASSAIMGFRVLVLHFDRRRCMSIIIYTLLLLQFLSSILILGLFLKAELAFTMPPWIVVPLVVGMVIDTIMCAIVVIPILCGPGWPRSGQVLHLLLSDALFFGTISIIVKALAIGMCLARRHHTPMDKLVAFRIQLVVCTIFACRIFRGQEVFLREHQDQAANPVLNNEVPLTAVCLTEHAGPMGDETAPASRTESTPTLLQPSAPVVADTSSTTR